VNLLGGFGQMLAVHVADRQNFDAAGFESSSHVRQAVTSTAHQAEFDLAAARWSFGGEGGDLGGRDRAGGSQTEKFTTIELFHAASFHNGRQAGSKKTVGAPTPSVNVSERV
jgi:hypothetical protein